ncbi:hypothetical protein V5F77_27830 [Xanthobacter sp. DSM 24535]|uniref:hypothetical protein n=1 Tax=Roseixanthobacter psychrophilus TaxID=3119917 RepID=UPI00372C8A4E
MLSFWTRGRVEESPAFLEMAQKYDTVVRAPLAHAMRHNRPELIKAFFVKTSENTFLYISSTFPLLLVTTYLHMPRGDALKPILWGSALEVTVTVLSGYVSDRIGRRPVLIVGLLAAALSSFSLFTLAPGATFNQMLPLVLLCLASHASSSAPWRPISRNCFPPLCATPRFRPAISSPRWREAPPRR